MSNEEFEDLFGNVPIKDLEKIKKFINDNYVSKEIVMILKERIHQLLDENAIARDYQIIVDDYFDKIVEEQNVSRLEIWKN